MTLPEPNLVNASDNSLDRWQSIQTFNQCFWAPRISSPASAECEVVPHKQQLGSKRPCPQPRFKDTSSLETWPLGRITATFPGADGVVRVVSRPATKVYPLT